MYPSCLKLHSPFFSSLSSGPGMCSRHILISSLLPSLGILLLVVLDGEEGGVVRQSSDLSG